MRMRKAVASGITGLLAMAALGRLWRRARHSSSAAPAAVTKTTAAASDFLPCIVSDAGGFDDKSFNQPSYEGLTAGGRRARHRVQERRVRQPRTTTPRTSRAWSTEGCNTIVTVGFTLAGRDRGVRQGQPGHQLRPRRRPADADDDGKTDADEHQADPLRHRSGGVPRRLRRGELLARPASSAPSAACRSRPSRSSWTASAAASTYYNEEKGKNVQVVGWDGDRTARSPVASRPTTTAKQTAPGLIDQDADVHPAGRRPDLPERRCRHRATPARTSR